MPMQSRNDPKVVQPQKQCTQYHAELLMRADCLYHYMDDFSHISVIDFDEFIIPSRKTLSWKDMINQIESDPKSKKAAAYSFDEGCFPTHRYGIPTLVEDRVINLRHKNNLRLKDLRRKNDLGYYHKSIIKPYLVTTMKVHEPTEVVANHDYTMYLNSTVGQLNHYRRACKYAKVDEPKVEDSLIEKYSQELIRNIQKTREIIRKLSRHNW